MATGSLLTWSPDGGRIAYQAIADPTGDVRVELQVIDVETEVQELLATCGALHGIGPVWSPDGEWVLYQRCAPANVCNGERHAVVLASVSDNPVRIQGATNTRGRSRRGDDDFPGARGPILCMGKKARAEVADALFNREGDNGLALVATGSYIGEGFDWPDLDTLFLAFPVAFKGRVVQYVGRLLRSHEGKHHVELHDYVDARIPVLERMHIKRLRAYRTLGFDHLPAGTGRRASRST